MKRLLSIAVCLCAFTAVLLAQSNPLVEANAKYQKGDLEGARALADKAVQDKKLAETPEPWVLRGFIYKDLYKAAPDAADAGLLRDEAMASLYTGARLDTAKQYADNALRAYDFLAKTIYNDAVHALSDMDDARAITFYAKYKEAVARTDPDANFAARDIDFENALGTVYTKRFNADRNQLDWYDKAVATYKQVLQQDSSNYGANYNLATLYYNRGVYNIQQISADNDIPSIQQIQEASRTFFTLALPYMLKAHDMDPTRKETLLGLEGIHYSLQDEEQSLYYRHKYEELKQDEGKPKEP
jgi:tetratricopeptide (TPR) repeat protein